MLSFYGYEIQIYKKCCNNYNLTHNNDTNMMNTFADQWLKHELGEYIAHK